MSKVKILSFAVAGLLLLNVALIVFYAFRAGAGHPAGKPGSSDGGPKKVIIARLHFDKAQTARYEALIKEHRRAIVEVDTRINAGKNALYATLNKEENPAGRDSLLAQIALLQQQAELTHYNHFKDIRELCTPAQRGYYKALTEDLARFFSPPERRGPPPAMRETK